MLRSTRGYSLVELAIALVLFGFLMALAYPNLSSWLTNLKIRATAEKIQSGLQFARSEALRKNTPVSFYFVDGLSNSCALSAIGSSGIVAQMSPAGACGAAPSDTDAPRILRKELLSEGATTISATDGVLAKSSVTFNGMGRVVTTSSWFSRVEVDAGPQDSNRKMRIQISAGGRIRLCDPAVSSVADARRCD